MSSPNMVCVGAIIGTHGVRGDIVLQTFTEDPMAILSYESLYNENKTKCFDFQYKGHVARGLLCHLEGVDTKEQAFTLRGTELFIDRKELSLLEDEDEFYLVDLEQLEIRLEDGSVIGKVLNAQDLGAGAYLEGCNKEGKPFTIPFTKEAVPEVCVEDGYLMVNSDFILTVGSEKSSAEKTKEGKKKR